MFRRKKPIILGASEMILLQQIKSINQSTDATNDLEYLNFELFWFNSDYNYVLLLINDFNIVKLALFKK